MKPLQAARDGDDKTRPCPSCRMMISILAVKCRYCGENVGRPKDEARNLTIDDLGGENATQYAPSSTVMEALESFRTEEEMKSNPPLGSKERPALFGLGKKKECDKKQFTTIESLSSAFPEFDAQQQADDDLYALARASQPKRGDKPVAPAWMKPVGYFAGLVAGIVIAYFGVVNVAAYFKGDDGPAGPVQPRYPNPAAEIMERGGPPIQALEAAVAAEEREDLPANHEITSKAQELVIEQVQALLDADDWTPANLTRASELANKAVNLYPSEATRQLLAEVQQECKAYQMVLVSVDRSRGGSGEAEFRLLEGGSGPQQVKAGDTLADRFEVDRIGHDYVRLIDRLRGGRTVVFHADGKIE